MCVKKLVKTISQCDSVVWPSVMCVRDSEIATTRMKLRTNCRGEALHSAISFNISIQRLTMNNLKH